MDWRASAPEEKRNASDTREIKDIVATMVQTMVEAIFGIKGRQVC